MVWDTWYDWAKVGMEEVDVVVDDEKKRGRMGV
jgi:hypothetical protein